MEGATNLKEDAPPENSPAPVVPSPDKDAKVEPTVTKSTLPANFLLTSPDKDQPFPDNDTKIEPNFPKSTQPENLVLTSPDKDQPFPDKDAKVEPNVPKTIPPENIVLTSLDKDQSSSHKDTKVEPNVSKSIPPENIVLTSPDKDHSSSEKDTKVEPNVPKSLAPENIVLTSPDKDHSSSDKDTKVKPDVTRPAPPENLVLTSPNKDQPFPDKDTKVEPYVTKPTPSENLVTTSPIPDADIKKPTPSENLVTTSPIPDADDIKRSEQNLVTTVPMQKNNESLENNKDGNATDFSSILGPNMDNIGSTQNRDVDASSGKVDSDALKSEIEEILETKIVARPSPDDDYIPPVSSSPQATSGSNFDQLIPESPTKSSMSSVPCKVPNSIGLGRGHIDTAAPFESVKAAVSKFGGIVDWKAHRVLTVERRKFIEQELEIAQEEIPLYKEQSEAAEEAKLQILKELDSTKRLIEELKLNLERAQTEEQQAKQDSDLANLRVEEMEQGIADEASFAAKAQLEVARARHAAATLELKTVKDELEQLRNDYTMLVVEKNAAVKKAEEAVYASKGIEKSVEDLTIELMTAKESLESAHSAHLEAEEQRIGAIVAKEQETLNCEKELKEAQEELEKVKERTVLKRDLKSKLDTATVLLQELKAELAAYMGSKLKPGSGDEGEMQDRLKEPEKQTRRDIEAAVTSAKDELEELKTNIENATDKIKSLRIASSSLTSQLEQEKTELASVQQREGMALVALASLEDEMNRIMSEIALAQLKEKEEKEKMVELEKKVEEAAQEADQAKVLNHEAHEELQKAKENAEEAKAAESTTQSRLCAALKEIEAAKASEKLAQAAMNALVQSESFKENNNNEDSPKGVTISLEEYYELSKRAHEAEEHANMLVAGAISEIEEAKESELRSLNKLEKFSRETAEKRAALEIAMQDAEKAKEEKLGVEQELRMWRGKHEQRRKAGESVPATVNTSSKSPRASFEDEKEGRNFCSTPDSSTLHHRLSPRKSTSNVETELSPEVNDTKKKKKSFFPRIFMFLARRKAKASKLA